MGKKIKYLIDLERSLYPDVWKIKKHYMNVDGEDPKPGEEKYLSYYEVLIMDEALDPFEVSIDSEGLKIDVDGYNNIDLTMRHIDFFKDALYDFDNEYEPSYKKWEKAQDKLEKS